MTITLDFGTLFAIVTRSLSIIGKRSTDDNGNRLFADVTLGTREHDIIADFFYNAFVDLSAELNEFLTAVIDNPSGITSVIYCTFWTDQAASNFVSQITESGQYLYKYNSNDLYVSSLTYPFSYTNPASGTLFRYNGSFYRWNGSNLTLISDPTTLTEQQRLAAIDLVYYDTNPSMVSGTAENQYLYYNGSVYKSSRQASFSSASVPSGAALVGPQGRVYTVEGNIITEVPASILDTVTLSLTMPDNWNTGLQQAMFQAVSTYCVSYALYSWFTVTAPRIAEKYLGDMKRSLTAVVRMANDKTPPDGSIDVLSTTTSVS